MKKYILLSVSLLITLMTCHAQVNGIRFQENKNWNEILAEAKVTGKFIFVDCYATWCGPCKAMDRDVYTDRNVGAFFNQHFIAVKMQMDTSKNDNDTVKRRYPDAHQIHDSYAIRALPTYLFFDSEGRIVHRSQGFQRPQQFVHTCQDALNPAHQYYTELSAFQKGTLSYSAMPALSKAAGENNDKELAGRVARDYIQKYLYKLNDSALLTKDHLVFIETTARSVTTKDRIFNIFRNMPATVDSLMHDKEYAERWLRFVIYNSEVVLIMDEWKAQNKLPHWRQLGNWLTKQYGSKEAVTCVISAKISWYRSHKDAANYTKYLTIQTDEDFKKNGIRPGLTGVLINNTAFEIFQYDNNKKDLLKALNWMIALNKLQSKPNPILLDTQGEVLYKLGRTADAIQIESQALALHPDPRVQDVPGEITKMQKGLKIWPDKMP